MQIACHRCGGMLEEGTPFCPQCGAAQIRVGGAQSDTPATPPLPPGTPGSMQPPAYPVAFGEAPRLSWEHGMRAAAITGLAAGLVSAVPLLEFGCCLWVIGAGALAVMLYQRRVPGTAPVTAGMGARLGAVSGLLAFVVYIVLKVGIVALMGAGRFREAMLEGMRQSAQRNPDPNAQQMIARLSTPEGLAFMIALLVGMALVAFLVFGTIGGTIGASIWGKRQTPQPPY